MAPQVPTTLQKNPSYKKYINYKRLKAEINYLTNMKKDNTRLKSIGFDYAQTICLYTTPSFITLKIIFAQYIFFFK